MILGDSNGKYITKNNANVNQDAVFVLENINFFDIDVITLAPFLYDINDELFDLIIGQLDGSITILKIQEQLIIQFSHIY